MINLAGVYPPLTTPWKADGSLDAAGLRQNVERYNRVDLAGYVAVGSTGESVLLTAAEYRTILETVRDAAAPGKILIAGTGVDSTAGTISRTHLAAELGYAVALVKTPYYYKPQMTAQVYLEHYRRVADASAMPILLYSVPQFTGVALEAEVVARLAEHGNIIGIKESSGSIQRIAEIIAAAPPQFQTLVGSASTVFASFAVGAVGAILGLANPLPELCVELYQLAQANETKKARELQRRLVPASKRIVGEFGISGTKYAMDCRGFRGGDPRPPLLPLTAAQKREVETILAPLTAPFTAK